MAIKNFECTLTIEIPPGEFRNIKTSKVATIKVHQAILFAFFEKGVNPTFHDLQNPSGKHIYTFTFSCEKEIIGELEQALKESHETVKKVEIKRA